MIEFMLIRKFIVAIVLGLTNIFCFAQDPELLLNEYRYGVHAHAYNQLGTKDWSVGPGIGLNYCFANLVFGDFNKKKFRFGDIVGGGIIPIGYTSSSLPPVPIYIWAKFELGLQAYYALSNEIDLGLRYAWYTDADWNRAYFNSYLEPVFRYKNLLFQAAFGSNPNISDKHLQITSKYIFIHEDALKGIFLRYESYKHSDKMLSIGYSTHFANHR